MKTAWGMVLLLIAGHSGAWGAPPAKKAPLTIFFGGWTTATVYRDTWELTGGRPWVRSKDGSFSMEADKVTLTVVSAKKGQASIRAATATGNVQLESKPEPGQSVKASSASAEYHGEQNQAVLKGKVHVIMTDPIRFAEPAEMVGETATINLKPKPGEMRIQVKGSQEQSRLTVTPKPSEEEQPASKPSEAKPKE